MFEDFKKDEDFFNQYLHFFIERFVYGINAQEFKEKNTDRISMIRDSIEAITTLLNFEGDKFGLTEISTIGNIINRSSGISLGFRKINVLAGADFIPEPPKKISMALIVLLDNYYKIWDLLDPYEREAMFHINFMRIHPFEDGNKRVSKTILNANLIRQNNAPVIITETDTPQYYRFIEQMDYIGFAEFLRERASVEINTMVGFYKQINKIDSSTTGSKTILLTKPKPLSETTIN